MKDTDLPVLLRHFKSGTGNYPVCYTYRHNGYAAAAPPDGSSLPGNV